MEEPSVEDKVFCRIQLMVQAAAARKAGVTSREWEAYAIAKCRWATETLGNKELEHLIAYVWGERGTL